MSTQKKQQRGTVYALALSLITGLVMLGCPMHEELGRPGPGGPGRGSEGSEYENGIHPRVPPANSITAFSITGPVLAEGVINQAARTIAVTVPVGTPVTAMTASATYTGVSISPDPEAARSYGEPVRYTVGAADGTSRSYTVTVDVGKSSAADILDLSINGITGTFGDNGTNIHVVLPYGTSLEGLAPVISLSPGATVIPGSGEAQDFSGGPVAYKVTAEDGVSTKVHTVTADVGKSSAADILDLSINGVTGFINGTGINVVLPYGSGLEGLAPVIRLSPGATVIPGSGEAQDFSKGPVSYEVTAENGTSTKAYTVTADVGKSSAAEIIAFSINGTQGVIDGTEIGVTLPYGTSLGSLVPVISLSPGATVAPGSGEAQDFSKGPVSYTVTAENGTSTKAYTVRADIGKNSAAEILSFSIGEAEGFINGTEIGIVLPYGTSLGSLVPAISLSPGATVVPGSGEAQDFSKGAVSYTVTAEDGTSTKAYTVTADMGKSSAAEIIAFSINGTQGVIDGTEIGVTLPYGTSLGSLVPAISLSPGATVIPGSGEAQDFSKGAVTYTVTAENGTSTKAYQVTAGAEKNSAAEIISFSIDGAQGVIDGTGISVILPYEYRSKLGSMVPAISLSPGATVAPGSGEAKDFSKGAVSYTVTAENGKAKKLYTVTVTAPNNAAEITKLSANGVEGVIRGTEIDVIVPYETDLKSLRPAISLSPGATVVPGSGEAKDFSAGPVSYTVTAEDGKTQKGYTVRAAAGWHVASVGNDGTGTGTRAKPLASVEEALGRMAAAYAATPIWPERAARMKEASGGIIIMDEIAINGTIRIEGDVGYPPITLRDDPLSPGGKLRATAAIGDGNNLLQLEKGATVTLEGGLILEGLGPNSGTKIRGVYVGSRGDFIMKGGEISGNLAGNGRGSGVYIGNGGTFSMEGGKITGNTGLHGGGVYAGGDFTMKGGEISGNSATDDDRGYGGGVYVQGDFTMSGGKISGNSADDEYGSGGGVFIYELGSFTMEGGEISGNSAAAADRGYGGGVSCIGSLTMNAGKISGNYAGEWGGGVYVGLIYGGVSQTSGTFTMNGGEISGNIAGDVGPDGIVPFYDPDSSRKSGKGAGVYTGGTFTMKNGKISGNAAYGYGGGVSIQGGDGTFNMEGGEISGNSSGWGAAGVDLTASGYLYFTKTGGTIYGYDPNDPRSNVIKQDRDVSQDGCAVFGISYGGISTTVGPEVKLIINAKEGYYRLTPIQ